MIGFMLAATHGCQEGPTPANVRKASPEIEPLPGTALTVAALAEIYRSALAEPMRYGHMNRSRAELLRAAVDRTEGPQQMMTRYQYASELLSAGDTEEAIRQIEQLMTDGGPENRALSSANKPLFELLALSHLRLGEQRNRRSGNQAEASILPLGKDALHTDEAGSRRAIELYRQILDRFPQDLQTRWLLNIAYMTVGAYPHDVPAAVLIEGIEANADTEFPRFANIAPALGVNVDGIAGGVSLEDFNEDGFIDVLTTARGLNDQMRLFFADGEGGFVDHTGAAGLNGLVGGLNTAHADYDNDGYDDVFIVRGGWLGEYGTHPNSLLKNNGDGTFEDAAVAAGLTSKHPSQTAAWGDFNNDGWIDIFIGNEAGRHGGGSGRSELYLNDGDGTFTEISARVGIDVNEFVKAVAWGDIDNDGLLDLYLSIVDQPNKLYRNRGGTTLDDWHFEEAGASAGVQEPIASFPVFFWDYNNDGWEDLFVASFDIPNSFVAPGMIAAQMLGRRTRG